MYSKEELSKKITELYPDIGKYAIDITVEFDEEKRVWVVDLKKNNYGLNHHLATDDADACMEGKQCISLALEIAQIIYNIKLEGQQY